MNHSESVPPRPRNAVLETLASFKAFQDGLPLAIGIHKAIRTRLPEIDPVQLKIAMRMHTTSTRYLKALSRAETRFDLDGVPSGTITSEQRKQAEDTLRERYRKMTERKQAQQAEQLAQQQAQQRQENLLKLVEKFNTR